MLRFSPQLAKVPAERFPEIARQAAASGGFFVPTLAAFERIGEMRIPFDQMVSTEADAAYVAPWIIDQWRTRRDSLASQGFTPGGFSRDGGDPQADCQSVSRRGRADDGRIGHAAPVPCVGFRADQGARGSFSAGLGPLGALRSATVVPRDYLRSLPHQGSALGWTANFGTIEPGARADLLLLDRDPSRDISALRSIRAVVAGGRAVRAGCAREDAGRGPQKRKGTAEAWGLNHCLRSEPPGRNCCVEGK